MTLARARIPGRGEPAAAELLAKGGIGLMRPRVPRSVVVAGLEKLDAVLEDLVHQAVGLVASARPDVPAEMLERLRLADAGERIAQHHLHQIQHAERRPAVGVDPMP